MSFLRRLLSPLVCLFRGHLLRGRCLEVTRITGKNAFCRRCKRGFTIDWSDL